MRNPFVSFLLALALSACAHAEAGPPRRPIDAAAGSPSAGGTKITIPESVVKNACAYDTDCPADRRCINQLCIGSTITISR